MFADLARRGLTHPHAVAYVKRAVSVKVEGHERVDITDDIPTWGIVLLYVSFVVAAVGISLVRRQPLETTRNAHVLTS